MRRSTDSDALPKKNEGFPFLTLHAKQTPQVRLKFTKEGNTRIMQWKREEGVHWLQMGVQKAKYKAL